MIAILLTHPDMIGRLPYMLVTLGLGLFVYLMISDRRRG